MKLNYKEEGPQGTVTNVILIHGLFGNLDNLGLLAKQLASRCRVISVDVRNHGASPHRADMSYPLMAADILELMDQLELTKVSLVGHSMGGKVAMTLAQTCAERIERLVVVDMAPVAYPANEHLAVFEALQAVVGRGAQTRQEADAIMASRLPDPAVRQFLLKSFQPGAISPWRFNLDSLMEHYPELMGWPPQPGSYPGPTLFIKGARSNYLRPEHQAAIQAQFPAAQARVILDAGHWPHAEKPLIFNRLVVDFLSVSG